MALSHDQSRIQVGDPTDVKYYVYVAVILVVCLLVFCAAVGNGLLCFVILRSKHLRHMSDLYIASLATADLLMCLIVFPFSAVHELNPSIHLNTNICEIMLFLESSLCAVMIYTMSVICMDVCFYVKQSFETLHSITRNKIRTLIACIWGAGFLLCAVPSVLNELGVGLLQTDGDTDTCTLFREKMYTANVSGAVIFLLPFLWCIYVYVEVLVRVRALEAVRRSYRKAQLQFDTKQYDLPKVGLFTVTDMHRGILTLGIKLFVFFCSWLPFFVVKVMHSICHNDCAGLLAQSIVTFLPYVSSWVNPFIYGMLNKRVHDRLKHLCTCCHPESRLHRFSSTLYFKTLRLPNTHFPQYSPDDITPPTNTPHMSMSMDEETQRPGKNLFFPMNPKMSIKQGKCYRCVSIAEPGLERIMSNNMLTAMQEASSSSVDNYTNVASQICFKDKSCGHRHAEALAEVRHLLMTHQEDARLSSILKTSNPDFDHTKSEKPRARLMKIPIVWDTELPQADEEITKQSQGKDNHTNEFCRPQKSSRENVRCQSCQKRPDSAEGAQFPLGSASSPETFLNDVDGVSENMNALRYKTKLTNLNKESSLSLGARKKSRHTRDMQSSRKHIRQRSKQGSVKSTSKSISTDDLLPELDENNLKVVPRQSSKSGVQHKGTLLSPRQHLLEEQEGSLLSTRSITKSDGVMETEEGSDLRGEAVNTRFKSNSLEDRRLPQMRGTSSSRLDRERQRQHNELTRDEIKKRLRSEQKTATATLDSEIQHSFGITTQAHAWSERISATGSPGPGDTQQGTVHVDDKARDNSNISFENVGPAAPFDSDTIHQDTICITEFVRDSSFLCLHVGCETALVHGRSNSQQLPDTDPVKAKANTQKSQNVSEEGEKKAFDTPLKLKGNTTRTVKPCIQKLTYQNLLKLEGDTTSKIPPSDSVVAVASWTDSQDDLSTQEYKPDKKTPMNASSNRSPRISPVAWSNCTQRSVRSNPLAAQGGNLKNRVTSPTATSDSFCSSGPKPSKIPRSPGCGSLQVPRGNSPCPVLSESPKGLRREFSCTADSTHQYTACSVINSREKSKVPVRESPLLSGKKSTQSLTRESPHQVGKRNSDIPVRESSQPRSRKRTQSLTRESPRTVQKGKSEIPVRESSLPRSRKRTQSFTPESPRTVQKGKSENPVRESSLPRDTQSLTQASPRLTDKRKSEVLSITGKKGTQSLTSFQIRTEVQESSLLAGKRSTQSLNREPDSLVSHRSSRVPMRESPYLTASSGPKLQRLDSSYPTASGVPECIKWNSSHPYPDESESPPELRPDSPRTNLKIPNTLSWNFPHPRERKGADSAEWASSRPKEIRNPEVRRREAVHSSGKRSTHIPIGGSPNPISERITKLKTQESTFNRHSEAVDMHMMTKSEAGGMSDKSCSSEDVGNARTTQSIGSGDGVGKADTDDDDESVYFTDSLSLRNLMRVSSSENDDYDTENFWGIKTLNPRSTGRRSEVHVQPRPAMAEAGTWECSSLSSYSTLSSLFESQPQGVWAEVLSDPRLNDSSSSEDEEASKAESSSDEIFHSLSRHTLDSAKRNLKKTHYLPRPGSRVTSPTNRPARSREETAAPTSPSPGSRGQRRRGPKPIPRRK
ncbi:hypothetical protein V1264_015683 [Littorina saxatilis]